MSALESLVDKILSKKELSSVSRETVHFFIATYMKKHAISEDELESLPANSEKIIVKEARSHLRELVGRFHLKASKRAGFISRKDWASLLNTHTSTKERLAFYPEIKSYIYSLNPSSILDLGCGLNPIAMAEPSVKYFASDINDSDLDIVREFFKDKNIKGEVFFYDLAILKDRLPEADVVLMLKLLDFLEKKSSRLAERLLLSLKCKHIIVSFSTSKLSGKKMHRPERKWFENICFHNSIKFKKLEFGNEIFYHISK